MDKRVVITGASGHLGGKLFDYLEADTDWHPVGLDILKTDRKDCHLADFSKMGDWTEHLAGADAVVHLAADRSPDASWGSSVANNMDATLNLYHAAAQHNVRRVVFASSNWVHGGYRFSAEKLVPSVDPKPVNAYGVSKLFGERIGEYFVREHGLSVICLRIGWTQWTHDNAPGRHMAMGRWGQEMWLSDRDFLHGTERAIAADNVSYAVLNLMSDNPGMRWDIGPTKELIGYRPQDGWTADVTLPMKLKSLALKTITETLPDRLKTFGSDW